MFLFESSADPHIITVLTRSSPTRRDCDPKPTVAPPRHNGPSLPRHRQSPGSSPPPRFPASAASSVQNSSVAKALVSPRGWRSEEHTSELQSLMRISYAVFCLKKKR